LVDLFDTQFVQMENHGYDHGPVRRVPTRTPLDNVVAGHEAYVRLFGHPPRGYRAPNGMIGSPELRKLAELGYLFDSSIFPTHFPGRFDWSKVPTTDFLWEEIGLLECPISVTQRFRVPVGISYMQLIGWRVYRRLLSGGRWPEHLVVDLHLHDLFPGSWYQSLSFGHRLGYWRARRQRPMMGALHKLIETCLTQGYRSEWLGEHAVALLGSESHRARLEVVQLP
jgi:hypothetical protein